MGDSVRQVLIDSLNMGAPASAGLAEARVARAKDGDLLGFIDAADEIFTQAALVYDPRSSMWRATVVISTSSQPNTAEGAIAGYFYLTDGNVPLGVRRAQPDCVVLLDRSAGAARGIDAGVIDDAVHFWGGVSRLLARGRTEADLAAEDRVARDAAALVARADRFIETYRRGTAAPPDVAAPGRRIIPLARWMPRRAARGEDRGVA